MGIVNVTPDSFSDGGRFLDPAAAIAQGVQLVADGASILDIGGESTRPGAVPVSEAEELRRVIPVIEGLAREVSVPLSIDTMKARVAREALQAGASVVNDISGLLADPEMPSVCAATDCGVIVMHRQGISQTMQLAPTYVDVVAEVRAYFEGEWKRGQVSFLGRSLGRRVLSRPRRTLPRGKLVWFWACEESNRCLQ